VRVLVTGGAGYIGSETVRLLAARGHEPVVLDTLERGHRAAVEAAPLVVGSVTDGGLVERVLREHAIESVIHFAALKSVEASFGDPAGYFATNVGGSFALLGAMTRAGLANLVYSSSCAVYGTPSDLPVRETSELRPENPYGETKLLVERALRWFDEPGIRSVSLRYFNAAGAASDGRHGEDWTDAPNLVPVVIKAALGRGPAVRVLGSDYPTPDGTAIRDYIHVADLAEAHVLAVEALAGGLGSTILNLGTGRGSSVQEVVDAVARIGGRPVPTVDAPRRAGDPAAIWADAGRAAAVLGWRARHDLDTIVETAWRWHSTHLDGYGPERAAAPPVDLAEPA
jgi:UDP-glucose 4-epimerase